MANRANGTSSIDDLRLAVALADHRSMSAAAASLHIAQPSASNRLRSLERRIGVPLFDRGATGTRPTHAGVGYVERAREILALVQQAADEARRAAGRDRLRFGTFTSLSVSVFSALDALLPEGTLVDQRIQNGGQLVRLIAEGLLDGAVVALPPGLATPPGTQRIELGLDPMILVAPAAVPLPEPGRGNWPGTVHLASYSSQPDDVVQSLAGHGASPSVAGSAPIALAVARRRGELAAVPRTAWAVDPRPGEQIRRLGPALAAALGLVLPKPPHERLDGLAPDLGAALGLIPRAAD
ncbi:LysR family transcriptional regulator [Microlunatus sp. GCM10028923]|uniref:LysR family transcriptional regulator n=1 Tax=Microlunatus sp. GCM10028923 TaxID=3273400 RepID=UPI00361BB28F